MQHAMRALVVGKIATTLEQVVDGVGGDGNDEVVVVGEGDEVAEGGKY